MNIVVVVLVVIYVFFAMIATAHMGDEIDKTVPNPPDDYDGM